MQFIKIDDLYKILTSVYVFLVNDVADARHLHTSNAMSEAISEAYIDGYEGRM